MKLERSGDLIYWTYFMFDWQKEEQHPSDRVCQGCGKTMGRVGPVSDAKGTQYDGYVCHVDKILLWVRRA